MVKLKPVSIQKELSTIETSYDLAQRTLWCSMRPTGRPCFSVQLLQDLRQVQHWVQKTQRLPAAEPRIEYQVLSSAVPGVFSLGGDLHLFASLIQDKDSATLYDYMKACIDILYTNATGYDHQVTSIALVQGEALGGGFEAALSASVIVAERGASMGFPERLFNLFPGMGAFSFMRRRVGPDLAERMIKRANTYSAEELYDMGIVDVLAESGSGVGVVKDFILQHREMSANRDDPVTPVSSRFSNALQAMHEVNRLFDTLYYEELLKVGEIWVDACLGLTSRDLRLMAKLADAQLKRFVTEPDTELQNIERLSS